MNEQKWWDFIYYFLWGNFSGKKKEPVSQRRLILIATLFYTSESTLGPLPAQENEEGGYQNGKEHQYMKHRSKK